MGLLPQGLFSRIVERTRDDPPRFSRMLAQLFDAMAHGGDFGMESILHPPEWTRTEVVEFPGTVGGPWTRYFVAEGVGGEVSGVGGPNRPGSVPQHLPPNTQHPPRIGLVRYPRLVPKDAECAGKLKVRTLTNLYNERPTWLDLAHKKLDAAVFAAYGWDPAMGNEEILEKLLALNLERAAAERAGP